MQPSPSLDISILPLSPSCPSSVPQHPAEAQDTPCSKLVQRQSPLFEKSTCNSLDPTVLSSRLCEDSVAVSVSTTEVASTPPPSSNISRCCDFCCCCKCCLSVLRRLGFGRGSVDGFVKEVVGLCVFAALPIVCLIGFGTVLRDEIVTPTRRVGSSIFLGIGCIGHLVVLGMFVVTKKLKLCVICFSFVFVLEFLGITILRQWFVGTLDEGIFFNPFFHWLVIMLFLNVWLDGWPVFFSVVYVLFIIGALAKDLVYCKDYVDPLPSSTSLQMRSFYVRQYFTIFVPVLINIVSGIAFFLQYRAERKITNEIAMAMTTLKFDVPSIGKVLNGSRQSLSQNVLLLREIILNMKLYKTYLPAHLLPMAERSSNGCDLNPPDENETKVSSFGSCSSPSLFTSSAPSSSTPSVAFVASSLSIQSTSSCKTEIRELSRREVVYLFAVVRMDPLIDLGVLLSSFLEISNNVAQHFCGVFSTFCDRFVCITFNSTRPCPNPELRAVQAGISLLRCWSEWVVRQKHEDSSDLHVLRDWFGVRIALVTEVASVGNVGGEDIRRLAIVASGNPSFFAKSLRLLQKAEELSCLMVCHRSIQSAVRFSFLCCQVSIVDGDDVFEIVSSKSRKELFAGMECAHEMDDTLVDCDREEDLLERAWSLVRDGEVENALAVLHETDVVSERFVSMFEEQSMAWKKLKLH